MVHSPGFLKVVDEARPRVKEITIDEARARLKQNPQAILLDVREDKEWQNGHTVSARHLGKGILERDIETLIPDPNSEVIMYCGGGYRSALAAESLGQMGYANVRSMDGGIRAWREAGYPLEQGRERKN